MTHSLTKGDYNHTGLNLAEINGKNRLSRQRMYLRFYLDSWKIKIDCLLFFPADFGRSIMHKYGIILSLFCCFFAGSFFAAARSQAGIAGKDPACVGNCGSELADCLRPCRSGRNCNTECLAEPVNYASCVSLCQDEIQLCEGLCQEYNNSCIDSCP
jgi:hypothetical protein